MDSAKATNTQLVKRIDTLIETASHLVSSAQQGGLLRVAVSGPAPVSPQDYQRWRVSAQSTILAVCGSNSMYGRDFAAAAKQSPYAKNVKAGSGVLLALRDDLSEGILTIVTNSAFESMVSTASVDKASVNLQLSSDIYTHIAKNLDDKDYFHAVEESYKVVREKLREITGKEKAIDIFNPNAENNKYQNDIFGKTANPGTPEGDFFRGVAYLNLAIQFLRNEKSHTLATTVDKNLAIHYISLASLVYDLISRDEEK